MLINFRKNSPKFSGQTIRPVPIRGVRFSFLPSELSIWPAPYGLGLSFSSLASRHASALRRHLPLPLRSGAVTDMRFLLSLPRHASVNGDSAEEPLNHNSEEKFMETNTKQNQNKQGQGFNTKSRIFLSRDGQYMIHITVVRKHVNYYKKVLGADFVPKVKRDAA